MDIEIFGGGERVRAAGRILSEEDFSDYKNIRSLKLFPIPTARDGVHISGTEIVIADAVDKFSHGTYAIGYGFPAEIKERMKKKKIAFYDAASDEGFLEENAYITAIGTLCYVLGSCAKVPEDISFGIIGYGRIGAALTRMLLFLGAKIKIFTSKPLTRIDLGEVGIKTSEVEFTDFDLGEITGIDLLINTAPCNLSDAFPKKKLPGGLRVIDLASGDSFPGIKGVEYLPSLPDRMYPESSGGTYARRAVLSIKRNQKG